MSVCCAEQARQLLSAAAIGLGGKQIQNGLGIHAGCLTEEMVVQEDKYQSIFQIPLVLSTLFSRVSVCALLLRLFSHLKSWRYTLYFIAGLTTAVNTAFATFLLLQCKPRARLWDKTIPGHCWALKTVYSVDIFQIGKRRPQLPAKLGAWKTETKAYQQHLISCINYS